MVCLGLEPGAAGWKAQTNPLSYGGTQQLFLFITKNNPRRYKVNTPAAKINMIQLPLLFHGP